MRVIAGSARGRPLRAPATKGTRPTGDMIKGVIFSMLEAEAYRRGVEPDPGDDERDGRFAAAVAWPRVLELYAGSGALAIEALSRGAERADLVEPDPAARRAIAANLRATGLVDRATVHPLRAEAALSTLVGPYDLILLDPPYDEAGVSGILERLAAGGRAGPTAVLVWEHGRATVPPDRVAGEGAGPGPAPIVWRRVKTNTHGAAAVSLYVAAAE
jgi:16S rRNA (guanine966-N2)-methyltransferase